MTQTTMPAIAAPKVVPPARRRRRRRLLERPPVVWAIRLLTLVVVISLWQLWANGVSRALFAPPTEVAAALVRQFTTEPSLWGPIAASFAAFAIGMTMGVAVGIPAGLIIGRYRSVEFVLDPYVSFLYVIPSIAFVPLFVLWFGFSFQFQVVMVFESTVFPMLMNAAAGAKNVEEDLVDGGRSFCASEFQIMRTIIIPSSLPFVFAGLRIAFSAAWVGVVVAQMTGALAGLGGLIAEYAGVYQTADMLVPIFVIMAVGVLIHALTSWALVRATPWERGPVEDEGS